MSSPLAARGVGLDLWFGGTPVAGLAIGGALHFQQTVSPSISVNGTKVGNSSLSLNSLLIGPFADWFPDPHGGFHLGGTVGLARLSLSDKDDDTTAQSPVGFGGAFVIGYDWWVSKEWSLGITGRFMGSAVSDENNGVKGTAVSYQPCAYVLGVVLLMPFAVVGRRCVSVSPVRGTRRSRAVASAKVSPVNTAGP